MSVLDEVNRKVLKPKLNNVDAVRIANQLFALNVSSDGGKIKKLDSYDDCNFLVQGASGSMYTLKVHNGVDTNNTTFIDAQNAVLRHLHSHGVTCPTPLESVDGSWTAYVDVAGTEHPDSSTHHAVRLLTWVHGDVMNNATITYELLFNAGKFVGRMADALVSFDHPGFHRMHMWDLAHTHLVQEYVPLIQDSQVEATCLDVLKSFNSTCRPVFDELPKSVLQGDMNDANILVNAEGTDISGVIDFGDALYSCRVFELAICMAYLMMRPAQGLNHLETAVAVLEGYSSVTKLEPKEVELLRTLVAARLTQSIAMGAFSLSKDPTNEYLKLHAQPARKTLLSFWQISPEEVNTVFLAAVNGNNSDVDGLELEARIRMSNFAEIVSRSQSFLIRKIQRVRALLRTY